MSESYTMASFTNFCRPNDATALVVSEIYHEVLSYWKWRVMKNECEYVKDVQGRFRGSIHPGERLPPKMTVPWAPWSSFSPKRPLTEATFSSK